MQQIYVKTGPFGPEKKEKKCFILLLQVSSYRFQVTSYRLQVAALLWFYFPDINRPILRQLENV
jgi:hypothetical protein